MKSAAPLMVLLFGAGCAGTPGDGGPRVVLTTFQPLYSFASQVARGSPGLRIVNMAPRHLGPHDFHFDEPSHADRCARLVRRADAVVTLRSLALAEAFDGLYPWCRRHNVRLVEIDPMVAWEASAPRLPLAADPGGTPNPHVWLSLSHSVGLVGAIARDFSLLDPANADLYRENAARYQTRLRKLKAEFDAHFAESEDLSAVVITEGFPYLTADFAIDVQDAILESPPAAEVERRVREARVSVVIAEEPPAPEVARAVGRAGARVAVLSTLEEGWGEGEALDPGGYLKGMRRNLEILRDAFIR